MDKINIYCKQCGNILYMGKCLTCSGQKGMPIIRDFIEATEIVKNKHDKLKESKKILFDMWKSEWDNPQVTGVMIDIFKLRELKNILCGEEDELQD